jgi:tyrosyl-tRNA synthetase
MSELINSVKDENASDENASDENASNENASIENRMKLILSVGQECITEENLRELLKNKKQPVAYDGFEPSGRMHIAQGVLRTINVNKLVEAGCVMIFYVADWFASINNKLGGDLEKIRNCGKYMIEIWKACGMNMNGVTFVWASEMINLSSDYWSQVIDIAKSFSVDRIVRCSQVMGRSETETLSAAQILYPCMQCADIFQLGVDICSLGLDQRKVNMLALEYVDKVNGKIKDKKNKEKENSEKLDENEEILLSKPIILSHPMLMGLKEGQEKMSKSDTTSAIFVDDTEEEVNTKIKKAFCPLGKVEGNPILNWCKHLIFPYLNGCSFVIVSKDDVSTEYSSYSQLEEAFIKEKVHPGDLKNALKIIINRMLSPIRQHFESSSSAKALKELVKSYSITR